MNKTLRVWPVFAVAVFSVVLLLGPSASADTVPDPNIITFGDAAGSCGGAVMCSSDGTTGYTGTKPFDLTTIASWFQIDATTPPVNQLPATQTGPEPNGGAGAFLVVNDTGGTVTTFSFTVTNNFTGSTGCTNPGTTCNNFQANQPDHTYGGTSETLSGPDFLACTNGTTSGFPPDTCGSTAGQVAANFSGPGTVTYTWSGLDIPAGKDFDMTFASWSNVSASAVPEPSSLLLLGTGLLGLVGAARRKLFS